MTTFVSSDREAVERSEKIKNAIENLQASKTGRR